MRVAEAGATMSPMKPKEGIWTDIFILLITESGRENHRERKELWTRISVFGP
jgi:hypothetical protein